MRITWTDDNNKKQSGIVIDKYASYQTVTLADEKTTQLIAADYYIVKDDKGAIDHVLISSVMAID